MKKIINVKSKKSLIENLIENAIKVGDKDYEKKLRKRVVDLSRARDLAKGALKRAEENGQTDVAEKLRTRIEEIDTLLATYNTDTLDDDPVSSGASDGSEADENSGSDQDHDENAANKNDSDEQDDSSNKNGKASEDENADEQSGNQNGKEDGDDSDADADQKGKGDGEDSDSEQKDNGGNEEDDRSGSQSQGQDSDGNDDNAEGKTGSEGDAKNSQNDNKKADKQDGAGEDDQSDSDDSAEDSGIHNDVGSREGSDSDDQQDGQSKNGKDSKNSQDNNAQNKDSSGSNGSSSNNSENEDESSDQNSNGGEGSESNSQGQANNNNNRQDSEGGSGDENEDESADDSSDNGQDSKNQQNQDANSQKSNSSSPDKKDSKNTSSSKSKPSLEQDDSEGDGESDFQNPFADDDDISSNGGLPTGGPPPREATKDETIDLLGTLTGEGREGAKDALKDLIAKRKAAAGGATESFKPTGGQSLTEAVKGVRDMTDDEFGDYINDTYDLIDKADPVNYIDDIEDRKKKVGNWSQDPIVAQDLFGEDDLEIQKDYQKKKARAGAKAKYSRISGLKDFEMDFYAAIHNQVETIKQEYQSYEEINAEYESEDAIMKADIEKELPAEAKPIIDVYFDVSGSWEEKDIKIGEAAIASVKVFEDQGDIVLNVFFFSNDVDNVSMEHCRDTYGYGTQGWPKILQNIKATDAKNVLIMTDDDFERLSSWDDPDSPKMNGSLTVDGCVWYLWKNGKSSPCCLPKLKGRQGTRQYGFKS